MHSLIKISPLLFLALPIALISCKNAQKCFRGGVLEHVPSADPSTANQIQQNLNAYRKVISEAARQNVDILVLAEDGIFAPPLDRVELQKYTEDIPNPVDSPSPLNPCNNDTFMFRPILQALSCLAKDNGIYLVADMGDVKPCTDAVKSCPPDKVLLYNTQVVFDKSGNLIARYHKRNLFGEPYYNVPDVELVTFETDFGKFGLFVCFDIVYRSPAIDLMKLGVDSIAMSTAWHDMSPSGLAHEIQQGWAFTNEVNLIVSDLKEMQWGTTGSGLYSGRNGAISYVHTMKPAFPKLLIANIPVNSKNGDSCDANATSMYFDYNQDTSKYSQMLAASNLKIANLAKAADSLQLCDNGFCCNLDYTLKTNDTKVLANYKLVAKNGLFLGPRNWWEEICGIAAYDDDAKQWSFNETAVFESISLSANFSSQYIYPTAMTNLYNLTPANEWKYGTESNTTSLIVKSDEVIVTAMLYGRDYSKDPAFPVGETEFVTKIYEYKMPKGMDSEFTTTNGGNANLVEKTTESIVKANSNQPEISKTTQSSPQEFTTTNDKDANLDEKTTESIAKATSNQPEISKTTQSMPPLASKEPNKMLPYIISIPVGVISIAIIVMGVFWYRNRARMNENDAFAFSDLNSMY